MEGRFIFRIDEGSRDAAPRVSDEMTEASSAGRTQTLSLETKKSLCGIGEVSLAVVYG